MEPSYDISEPKVKISSKFQEYVERLDSWQLVGLETMTVWLKSTISATLIGNEEISVQEGINNARLEEQFQIERFGEVEEKVMDENHVRLMVNCGFLVHKLSQERRV